MSSVFVGRGTELDWLADRLSTVGAPGRDLPGVAVMLTGCRHAGKTRLAEVFCERSGVPFVFFRAARSVSASTSREAFAEAIRCAGLPGTERFADRADWATWVSFFRDLATALPEDQPSIVVVDGLSGLLESEPSLEGELQTGWDRFLSRKPVLLILVGSGLKALDDYHRPFHQRAQVMELAPLNREY